MRLNRVKSATDVARARVVRRQEGRSMRTLESPTSRALTDPERREERSGGGKMTRRKKMQQPRASAPPFSPDRPPTNRGGKKKKKNMTTQSSCRRVWLGRPDWNGLRGPRENHRDSPWILPATPAARSAIARPAGAAAGSTVCCTPRTRLPAPRFQPWGAHSQWVVGWPPCRALEAPRSPTPRGRRRSSSSAVDEPPDRSRRPINTAPLVGMNPAPPGEAPQVQQGNTI